MAHIRMRPRSVFVVISAVLLAALGPRALVVIAAEPSKDGRDWELVRTVENPYSGKIDLVLVPAHKTRDREYYLAIGNAVCDERKQCMIHYWSDRSRIPEAANMPVSSLAEMTATYERHPRYNEPALRLACWLYPNRETAELMKCGYFPGGKVPWKMTDTPAWAK